MFKKLQKLQERKADGRWIKRDQKDRKIGVTFDTDEEYICVYAYT